LLPLPAEPPDAPVCVGAAQLNVVPLTELLKEIDVAFPEQIDCPGGVATTFGTGLTVIVTLIGLPAHPDADGVIV
jgi:hypothetical protein